jgi:hypothetical protein
MDIRDSRWVKVVDICESKINTGAKYDSKGISKGVGLNEL